jgi:hypothetical protein
MKYKIETLTGDGFNQLPPPFINKVFPAFAGEMIETKGAEMFVTFPAETQVQPIAGLIIQKFNSQTNAWESV